MEYKLLSFHSLTKSSQPPNLHISTTSSLFNLLAALAFHLWLPSLDHQHHRSSLRITDRSFRYASPCLWNQLPIVLSVNLISAHVFVLPVHAPTTSVNSPLSPSITPSFFHSRLKTHAPLSQIFPIIDSLPASGLTPRTSRSGYFF